LSKVQMQSVRQGRALIDLYLTRLTPNKAKGDVSVIDREISSILDIASNMGIGEALIVLAGVNEIAQRYSDPWDPLASTIVDIEDFVEKAVIENRDKELVVNGHLFSALEGTLARSREMIEKVGLIYSILENIYGRARRKELLECGILKEDEPVEPTIACVVSSERCWQLV
jgi:hypothetical protein